MIKYNPLPGGITYFPDDEPKRTSILITGGTGSFGRAMTKTLLDGDINKIIIYSRDEVKQYKMSVEFPDDRMRFLIGDVRDQTRLRRAMSDVDIVIHAAALKRIEVGFYNPEEMKKTNVDGAENVIEASMNASVKKVVALSTDKAYQPISPYGQTKALAEMLFLNANNTRGANGPVFSVTRYGNVAGSRGSVIPLWREVLASSDTVQITDPDATRFWMTIQESVDLILDAMHLDHSGLMIPELPAYRLGDLAKAMGAKMDIIGLPDFEKLHEGMSDNLHSNTVRRMSVEEIREALKGV